MQPSIIEGDARLVLSGESKPFAADSIVREIKVVPDGFPVVHDPVFQVLRQRHVLSDGQHLPTDEQGDHRRPRPADKRA